MHNPVSRNVEMCKNDIYQIKNWRIEKKLLYTRNKGGKILMCVMFGSSSCNYIKTHGSVVEITLWAYNRPVLEP